MPSPFPGMDPFLEAHWGDVQTRLAMSFAVNLRKQLPGGLVARVEESVVLGIDDDDLPPAEIATQLVPRTQRSVHIYDAMMKMKLITAIDLIGPANKVGVKNREAYRSRASKALEAGASLVEVDLIRQGESVLCRPPTDPDGHYSICVVRPWDSEKGDVVAARFDEPLPTIQVPLRKKNPPLKLDLQRLLNRAYRDGNYESLDYTQSLHPPLTVVENRWFQTQLKNRNR